MGVREDSALRLVVVGHGPAGHRLVPRTGRCLDDPDQAVRSFRIRRTDVGDRVEVALP